MSDREDLGAIIVTHEIHYTTAGWLQRAPFTSKRSAMRTYRALCAARAAHKPYANDDTAMFELRSACGLASVVLSQVVNISLIDVAAASALKTSESPTHPQAEQEKDV